MFRTLDRRRREGQARAVRVDLNVPMRGRQGRGRHAHRAHGADHQRDRRQGRQGDPALAFRPAEGARSEDSLQPVAADVAQIIGRPVAFAEDCIGDKAEAAVAAMKPGDILCLENTRFHAGEEKNDPAFAAALAKLGDLWVNDAFSAAHRAHASTEGLGHVLPAYAGRSMQAELDALGKALEAPQRPVAAIVGGAKVSTKLDLLGNLIAKVDVLIIGGGMANTFLAAQGKAVGKSLVRARLWPAPRATILAKAKAQGCEIVLPVDAVVAQDIRGQRALARGRGGRRRLPTT